MSDKTAISLAPKLATGSIDHLADDLWDNLGSEHAAIVTFEVCERTEPSDTEADRKVKLRVVGIEIPLTDDGDEQLRKQQREMYARRTGQGGLFDGDSDRTGRDGQGRVTSVTFTSDGVERIGKLADTLKDA